MLRTAGGQNTASHPCGNTLKGTQAPRTLCQATGCCPSSRVESGCKPSLSPWWQCLGSGTTSSLPGEASAGLRSPCLLGCPSGQGGVDDSLDASFHTHSAVADPLARRLFFLIRVKAAPPTSRKAWAGGNLCRVHRSPPTQGFNFRHLLN